MGTELTISGNAVNLCDSCIHMYPDCPAKETDVVFGDGIGADNICACARYIVNVRGET